MEEVVIDPRQNLQAEPAVGQVYEDARTGDELTLVYVSERAVLLRDDGDEPDQEKWLGHRILSRKDFEQEAGARRYKLIGEADGSATTDAKLRQLNRMAEQYDDTSGRKAAHKAEALREAVELLDDDDSREPVDFESISGVGQKSADALRAAGYRTKGDIRSASDDALMEVRGVGEKNLSNIRDRVE